MEIRTIMFLKCLKSLHASTRKTFDDKKEEIIALNNYDLM